ncbi:hypothetical protein KP509_20G086000 [Ceratopteris richardii]|uniref:Uncharacterized protein n=1 Tax=Ceratopteris richardii TaxID=49495 RepID=A0A8T2SKF9_CERRI|nr:hypothetical protein KP509_20G086000 [Ceratopteris richardii]
MVACTAFSFYPLSVLAFLINASIDSLTVCVSYFSLPSSYFLRLILRDKYGEHKDLLQPNNSLCQYKDELRAI